jgi:hypothetical protein
MWKPDAVINQVLDEPVVSLEGAWGIRLRCHQFRKPFSILGNLLISVSHMVLFFQGGGVVVYSFQQSLNSSL